MRERSATSLLLRFFRVQELLAREERRERPEWLRLMRLKRLAIVVRQRLEEIGQGRALAGPGRFVAVPVRAAR